MSDIESIPGVGPQLAQKLRRAFRTDAGFFDAAQRMDLQAVAAVDGVSERRAVDLVLAARGDTGHESFFGTPAARRVHDRIMQRLLRYASTDTGRNRLRLLHPLPTQAAADAHIQSVLAAKEMAADVDAAAVRRELRNITPPRAPRAILDTGLLVVAESDDVYERLHGLGVPQWATLGTPRDLENADGYDVLVIAYDEGTLDASAFPHAIDVSADGDLSDFCPDAMLQGIEERRAAIVSCASLAERFDRPSRAAELLAALETTDAKAVRPQDIRTAVNTLKSELDQELEAKVADMSLSGPEMLRAMSQGRLPMELQTAIDAVLRRARDSLRVATGTAFQPYTSGLPLGIDDDEVERVIDDLEAGAQLERFRKRQQAAAAARRVLPDVEDEMRAWLEFDATFALGRFAVEHDLHAPTWSERLAFTGSVHLDLAHSPHAQRIDYHLGGDENVAVLTGANSGGKSTLLEHVTQIAVMARIGLPVVGRADVPWFDEVHLVTARRGMDAGAFETFLRGFLPVTAGNARRLVLADEVESVTELQAAGRIIAFVLDRLARSNSLAVVVTHLAPQVLAEVQTATVRVDGIEASGLDDQHRLVVDRCPKIGRAARSTPELIVQRLAATTKGTEQSLYVDLLDAFQRHG